MWLGESIGFWLQTAMLAIAAIAGVWAIISRGRQERRRATVELIMEQKRDKDLNEARALMHQLAIENVKNLSQFIQEPTSSQYKAITLVLNSYEFLASGVRTNAFSDEIYKRLRFTQLIQDWGRLQGFITEIRIVNGKATLFQDFEWLYGRWSAKPLKRN